jgi:signal transduction histidine kinase
MMPRIRPAAASSRAPRPAKSPLRRGAGVEQLRLLYTVATALSTSLNLSDTLHNVLKGLRSCIRFDAASIFLLDPGQQHLIVKAALGVTVTLDEVKRFRVGEGVVGWVVEHNRSALISDVARDPRYHAAGSPRKQGALLAVPLRSGERVTGALVLVRRATRAFVEADRLLAEAIAGQAAVAIEHARLFETERQFRRRAEALLATTQTGSESQELDQLLDGAVAQFRRWLMADTALVVSWDSQSENFAAIRSDGGRTPSVLAAALGNRGSDRTLERAMATQRGPLVLRRDAGLGPLREDTWAALRARTALVIPMRWRERLLAVGFCLFEDRREFDAAELELAQDLAAQLAAGIERLTLQREVQEAQNQVAVASERNRIARDLHDGLVQYVYALGLKLEHVRDLVRNDHNGAHAIVTGCIEQSNHVLAELRTFIYQLRPIIMREKEIGQWIRELCQQFERATGIRVAARVGATGGRQLSPEISIALFRILQEALANIYHHAGAEEAGLQLTFGRSAVRLVVEDRGRGFDPSQGRRRSIGGGHGLANIQERVQDLGGVVTIESKPGQGTRVAAAIPYGKRPAHPQTPIQTDVA